MNKSQGIWAGVIAVVVLIALGLWWFSATEGVNTTTNAPVATTTASTSTSAGPRYNDRSSDTVQGIVASLGATQFESLFNSTGVSSMLKASGEYTVFVPTNAAFSAQPQGTISKMTAAQLKRLVEYHVVSGREIQPGAEMAGAIQALSGDPLNFSDLNNIAMVNSSIIVAEYKGSNGVVYVINELLIPPQKSNL